MVRLEKMRASTRSNVNIEITTTFVKCRYSANFDDQLKFKPRVASKGNIGDFMPFMEKDLWLSLSLYRQVI